MDDSRRASLTTVAICAAVAGALALLFGVVLEPARGVSCNTDLLDGPYKSAVLPAHLLAAAVLTWVIWRERTPARLRWLAVVWVGIGVCLLLPGLLGLISLIAIFVAPLVGLALVAATIANLPRIAPAWPWAGLVFGLPASLGYVYLGGATPFCF